jgi:outer membrane biosynthesis protein TonB
MKRPYLLAVLLLPAAGCASAQAKAPVEVVSLDVPPVPPRVIDPVETSRPAVIEPVEELPPAPEPAPAKPRPPSRDTARDTAKPEAKPEAPAEPEATQPAPAPVPPLRTQPSVTDAEADRQIREILARANKLLDNVDPRGLSDDRRANYESAKDSVKRAEDALRASNWVLARSVAERAETIAKLLASR